MLCAYRPELSSMSPYSIKNSISGMGTEVATTTNLDMMLNVQMFAPFTFEGPLKPQYLELWLKLELSFIVCPINNCKQCTVS